MSGDQASDKPPNPTGSNPALFAPGRATRSRLDWSSRLGGPGHIVWPHTDEGLTKLQQKLDDLDLKGSESDSDDIPNPFFAVYPLTTATNTAVPGQKTAETAHSTREPVLKSTETNCPDTLDKIDRSTCDGETGDSERISTHEEKGPFLTVGRIESPTIAPGILKDSSSGSPTDASLTAEKSLTAQVTRPEPDPPVDDGFNYDGDSGSSSCEPPSIQAVKSERAGFDESGFITCSPGHTAKRPRVSLRRAGKAVDRSEHKPDGNDEDDSEEDSNNGWRRRRPHNNDPTSPDQPHRNFACPFYKNNPDNCEARAPCRRKGWGVPDLARLYSHILRVHLKPHQCTRCGYRAGEPGQIDGHETSKTRCTRQNFQPVPLWNSAMANAIRRPPSWEYMYTLLFHCTDGSIEIPDPYAETLETAEIPETSTTEVTSQGDSPDSSSARAGTPTALDADDFARSAIPVFKKVFFEYLVNRGYTVTMSPQSTPLSGPSGVVGGNTANSSSSFLPLSRPSSCDEQPALDSSNQPVVIPSPQVEASYQVSSNITMGSEEPFLPMDLHWNGAINTSDQSEPWDLGGFGAGADPTGQMEDVHPIPRPVDEDMLRELGLLD